MRLLARTAVWTAAPALLLLAGCGVQPGAADESESVELRSPRVETAVHHDLSAPLELILPVRPSLEEREHPVKPIPRRFNRGARDPVVQASAVPLLIPAPATNFDGIGQGFSGPAGVFTVNSAPPDTNGDVGPNHYVQIVNSDFAVFNKAGTVLFGPVPINTLWSGFGGGCQANNDGDPVVLYDPMADRWVISQFSVTTQPFLQCVAVSTTPDPTGQYARYAFQYASFPDYPKMGVWPDAYYETFNLFNAAGTAFLGTQICAYDRAKMLAGQAATQQCFTTSTAFGGLLPSDLDGARLPPAGAPNWIVGMGSAANQLAFWRFHVDFTTPANSTLTGPSTLATAAFAEACNGGTCIPQSGTAQRLDSLADRVMFRLAYRNLGDHEAMVLNHSVTAGSSTGIRWYELRPNGASLSIFQQGTYAPDANFRWMGSAAMDQAGNIALGFSVSSTSLHPQIRYTGRLAGDAPGQMTQGEGTIIAGAGSQTGSSLSRWGDYSMLAVDPTDDCTFWFTTEYIPANGAFNWKTRIGSFRFPGCGAAAANDFSITPSPASQSVQQGASTSYTVATAVTSGAAETVSLSVSGVPSGATASFSPAAVTAGGSSTLTVGTGTAAAGTYTLTITGTAPSATHSATVSLAVTAPPPPPPANDFSIAVSPASQTVTAGSSTTYTVTTALTTGAAQTITLSASGLPAGATASFSPASVTSGSSSTLTVATASSTPAATTTLTVTGTAASGSHSATTSLTVNAPPPPPPPPPIGLVNGGFESGLTGWTVLGSATTSATAHTGAASAMVGSAAAFNGDSSVSQTFTAPAGGGTLTFWYQPHCTDTVTFDWALVTLKDNVTGTTATLLPKTCANSTVWRQVSYDLAPNAGHGVTLTLLDHDDNFAGDPTYTLYDDVAIGAPPPAATELIVNGGFDGSLSGWTLGGAKLPILSTAQIHSGTSSIRCGSSNGTGTDLNGDSSAFQSVSIPASASTATLTFWYFAATLDTITFDWQDAQVRSSTGAVLINIFHMASNTQVWTQRTVDLTPFRGQTVQIYFNAHDDGFSGDPTSLWIDDVSVKVQ